MLEIDCYDASDDARSIQNGSLVNMDCSLVNSVKIHVISVLSI